MKRRVAVEPALSPDAGEIRALVARTVEHSVTRDARRGSRSRSVASTWWLACKGERHGFVPRDATQPLPPGFQAMSRPL